MTRLLPPPSPQRIGELVILLAEAVLERNQRNGAGQVPPDLRWLIASAAAMAPEAAAVCPHVRRVLDGTELATRTVQPAGSSQVPSSSLDRSGGVPTKRRRRHAGSASRPSPSAS
jgi:hypothetical protein